MYITVVHAHIMIPVYLCTGTCVITLAHTYFYLTFWCVIVDSITLPSAVVSSRSKDCVVSVMSRMAAAGGIRQIWKLQVFAYFYYGGLSVKKWNFIWEGDPWYEFYSTVKLISSTLTQSAVVLNSSTLTQYAARALYLGFRCMAVSLPLSIIPFSPFAGCEL